MTVLRDRTTPREDFIFFVDRLATYLIEKAMEHLPHRTRTVVTPIDLEYHGLELDADVRSLSVISTIQINQSTVVRCVHSAIVSLLWLSCAS